jgi:putative NADH-flavin reductase
MRIVKALAILSLTLGTAAAESESRSIAVIGGAGMIGQRIVREALDRGHAVLLIARDPARVTERHPRLQLAEGDVLDSAGLAPLLAGQDVLVSAVGTARAKAPDYTLYRRAAESLVTTLRKAGPEAPRLIVVGGVGSLQDASGEMVLERVPEDRRPEHLGQKAALDFYRSVKDVRWTYVSPPARIAPGERTGKYRTGGDEVVRDAQGESRISMEDYAVAVIDEVEQPAHIGRRFTVGY